MSDPVPAGEDQPIYRDMLLKEYSAYFQKSLQSEPHTTYHTTVAWKGEHWGHIMMGNGPEMEFSAPPDAQGHPGVLTPEDAFVAAANTCIMMMFIWATEATQDSSTSLSYDCRAEGTKLIDWTAQKSLPIYNSSIIRIAAGNEARRLWKRVFAEPYNPPKSYRCKLSKVRDHHRKRVYLRSLNETIN